MLLLLLVQSLIPLSARCWWCSQSPDDWAKLNVSTAAWVRVNTSSISCCHWQPSVSVNCLVFGLLMSMSVETAPLYNRFHSISGNSKAFFCPCGFTCLQFLVTFSSRFNLFHNNNWLGVCVCKSKMWTRLNEHFYDNTLLNIALGLFALFSVFIVTWHTRPILRSSTFTSFVIYPESTIPLKVVMKTVNSTCCYH